MGAPRLRLTERTIGALPVPEKSHRIHYDDLVKGLGLRVTKAGGRAFVSNYHVNGRERRLTIGPWPEWSATAAKDRAKELRREIDRGDDPLADKIQRRGEPTFGELVEQYLTVKASKQKGKAEYERILRKNTLPRWGNIAATDISRRDAITLVEKKAETAPTAANRLLELLMRLFNFAIDREVLEANPCARVQKPGGKEISRDRVRSPDEIRDLWIALDCQWFAEQTAAALRLILVTAQRPGEVVSMRHEDLDLGDGWWTIPAGRAKNCLAHRVPLRRIARRILQSLPDGSPWIFPSPGMDQHIDRNALALAIRRARQRNEDPLEVDDFSSYNLRRTAASQMASVGVERFVIGKLLNHVEPSVTKVYDRHSYDSEKKNAMDKWARELSSILAAEQAKVVEVSASWAGTACEVRVVAIGRLASSGKTQSSRPFRASPLRTNSTPICQPRKSGPKTTNKALWRWRSIAKSPSCRKRGRRQGDRLRKSAQVQRCRAIGKPKAGAAV